MREKTVSAWIVFALCLAAVSLAAGDGAPEENGCPELAIRLGPPDVNFTSSAAEVPVILDTGKDQPVSGFQFGVGYTGERVIITGVDQGEAVEEAGGADFFTVKLVEGGVDVGAVLDLNPEGDPPVFRVLPPCTENQELVRVKFTCNPEPRGENVSPEVFLSGELGDPPVAIIVAVRGQSFSPQVGEKISLPLHCPDPQPFVRGDVTQNGLVDISDAIAVAKAVFGFGDRYLMIRNCMDSADANDDGRVNTADPIFLLQFLFAGGPDVPPPRECGRDLTPSTLPPCEEYYCR